MKTGFLICTLFFSTFCSAQLSERDSDVMDSLITATPQIDLCKKNGKDDERFMNRTPEKYSSYKQEFMAEAIPDLDFAEKSRFFCDITVEINCEGKAGNYSFAIEPRGFGPADFVNFRQLISVVEKLRNHHFQPAVNLGENVNSKMHFRLSSKNGKPVIQ